MGNVITWVLIKLIIPMLSIRVTTRALGLLRYPMNTTTRFYKIKCKRKVRFEWFLESILFGKRYSWVAWFKTWNTYLGKWFDCRGGARVWMGLYRVSAATNTWAWLSGLTLSYDDWNPTEPDGSGPCGTLQASPNFWRDKNCDEQFKYLCQIAR